MCSLCAFCLAYCCLYLQNAIKIGSIGIVLYMYEYIHTYIHTYVGFLTSEIENVAPLGLPRPPLHTFHTIVLENKIPRFVGA